MALVRVSRKSCLVDLACGADSAGSGDRSRLRAYFFFQAEDGIRDVAVTGVQTCALPILFNGEIYNFQELRDQLTAKGHIFRTKTDTEAIVHLYEEYGPACVERLRGMFALDRKSVV